MLQEQGKLDEAEPLCVEAAAWMRANKGPQHLLTVAFVPGLVELATRHEVFIGGDDFKSGQTKMKSVLVDFLVSSGIKPVSIVSYNHLGNNDGKNLSAPQTFRSTVESGRQEARRQETQNCNLMARARRRCDFAGKRH